MPEFKAKYIDRFGEEESFFISDGSSLKITLRNYDFEGRSFNMLSPIESEINERKEKFDLNDRNELVNYIFHITIPIRIKYYTEHKIAYLNFTTDCTDQDDYYIFKDIELIYEDELYSLKDAVTEVFEYVLIHLQRSLPKHIYIISCISCKYGNYHPAGQSEYGGMHCFRKFKAESKLINSKDAYFKITENKEILQVQETHYCEEYEELTTNDWNYNDWGNCILENK